MSAAASFDVVREGAPLTLTGPAVRVPQEPGAHYGTLKREVRRALEAAR